jgi:hypothetical protein
LQLKLTRVLDANQQPDVHQKKVDIRFNGSRGQSLYINTIRLAKKELRQKQAIAKFQ